MSKKDKYTIGEGELLVRFTPAQAEIAAQISNDIAEDIDNGQSRTALRMAVAYYADLAAVNGQRMATAEHKLQMVVHASAALEQCHGILKTVLEN